MRTIFYIMLMLVGLIMAINNDTDYVVFNFVGLFLLHLACKGLDLYYKG